MGVRNRHVPAVSVEELRAGKAARLPSEARQTGRLKLLRLIVAKACKHRVFITDVVIHAAGELQFAKFLSRL